LDVKACLSGMYPRSDALAQATRDHDRGRIGDQVLTQAFQAAWENLVALQEEAGLDLLSDGMLTWQDWFRPFVEAHSHLEAGPLTRWFQTNTFYRRPERVEDDALLSELDVVKFWQAWSNDFEFLRGGLLSLPSPNLWYAVMGGRTKSLQALVRVMYAALLQEISVFNDPPELIQFHDPVLAQDLVVPEAAREEFEAVLAGGPEGVRVALHLPFGSPWRVKGALTSDRIDLIGLDLRRVPYGELFELWANHSPLTGKGVMLGVVDGESAVVENPLRLLPALRNLLGQFERQGVREVWITNGTDLAYLPERVAREKVEVIGRVREQLAQ